MYGKLTTGGKRLGMSMLAGALLLGAAMASAQEAAPDDALAQWLGREFTVNSSTLNDQMPIGGKLTFVFDAEANVVRICTRNSEEQQTPWRMDFATPCGVTMLFTRGTRYCTIEDVKTGDAEVLSSCHRLRTRDVAMRPSKAKDAVELNDMIAFLVSGEDGYRGMTILVDSPARVTADGMIIIGPH